MAEVKWAFTADYVETCNCDYGCPCNFTGFPTDNKCEALVGYHIRQGHYGAVALDGLDCVYAAAWPNAIHEGNGTAMLFITEKASLAQRDALQAILTGQAGGRRAVCHFRRDDYDVAGAAVCTHRLCVCGQSEPLCGPGAFGGRAGRLHQSGHRRPQQS
jgi:hypothetical protein